MNYLIGNDNVLQTKDVKMKKLLVALVAMTMVSAAFADGHKNNMVRFDGLEQDNQNNRSFDVSFSSDDDDNEAQNIALNYHRAFGQWQVGISYRTYSTDDGTTNGEIKGSTVGLSGHYNFDEDLTNSCFIGLHVETHEASEGTYMGIGDEDSRQDISLEYGHRFSLGHLMGLHVTYAPAITYTMTSYDFDDDNNDLSSATDLSWNWIAFDVFF